MINGGYRPSKLQALNIIKIINDIQRNNTSRIIVHHVLEDSYRRLHVQIEKRNGSHVIFERILIEGD